MYVLFNVLATRKWHCPVSAIHSTLLFPTVVLCTAWWSIGSDTASRGSVGVNWHLY